jgi:hypothetical protein
VRGMELWRPDWAKINGEYGRVDAGELVSITKETARLAASAIRSQNERDYYHNYAAAERELTAVLSPGQTTS